MAAKHDYLGFAERELEHRRQMLSPPFQHFTRVILRGEDEAAVEQHAQQMATLLEETIEAEQLSIRVLGPAVAPIARLKGRYRYHFQLAASELEALRLLWRVASEKMPKSSGVEFVVDVDPLNMR